MESNKLILDYCKNFDYIMNTDFLEGDTLSNKLVEIYKNFIFKVDIRNEEDLKTAVKLDEVMGKYVEDYAFRKKLQEGMRQIKVKRGAADIIRTIVDGLIEIFKKYEIDATRKIYISKWL